LSDNNVANSMLTTIECENSYICI